MTMYSLLQESRPLTAHLERRGHTMNFFSAFPTELIARVMTCLLVQHGHLALLNFMNSFPEYSDMVLLVQPNPGVSEPSPLGFYPDSTEPLKCSHLFLSLPDGMFLGQDSYTIVREIQSFKAMVRVLLLPKIEVNVFRVWHPESFTSSTLALAIQCCDAVVVGAYKGQTHYRGIQFTSKLCSLVSTPLYVHIINDSKEIFTRKGFNKFFMKRPWHSSRDVEEFTCGANEDSTQRAIKFKPKVKTHQYVTLDGYLQCDLDAPKALGVRVAFPGECFGSQWGGRCIPPIVRLNVPKLKMLHVEFSSCCLPVCRSEEITHFTDLFVYQNNNWSSENPFGRKVCKHARSLGLHHQTEFSTTDILPYYIRSSNLILIGVPQCVFDTISLEDVLGLVWKRLEFPGPIRNSSARTLIFKSLWSLSLEGTSNHVYKRFIKISAPNLKRLSIVMLPKSTMIWDLRYLLYSPTGNDYYDKDVPATVLKSLRLQYHGSNVMVLGSTDIDCVANSLEDLWITGLLPRFFEDHSLVFTHLLSLKVDIGGGMMHSEYSWDLHSKNFPVLDRLVVGSSTDTFKCLCLTHIPKTLRIITICSTCKVILESVELSQRGTWCKATTSDPFKHFGDQVMEVLFLNRIIY